MFKNNNPAQRTHPPRRSRTETSWDAAADWYHSLVGDKGMGLQRTVVFPSTLRLLQLKRTETLLDIACGQGAFARFVHGQCARIAGVDASRRLIEIAKRSSPHDITYVTGDAGALPRGIAPAGGFDTATCILAIQNIDPIESVYSEAAKILKPGGRLVTVINHPCFRIPRQSGWEWDEKRKLQFRRIDHYMGFLKIPIQTHPGGASREVTWTFHRPLQHYIRATVQAGFAITALEEWTTDRKSTPGPRVKADMRAKQQIPLFLAFRAAKVNSQKHLIT